MTDVTAIFFSCTRLHLLKQTVEAFLKSNTYLISEIIIVNDSADEKIHEQLRQDYFKLALDNPITLILNENNVGLMKSIDLGYSHVKTPYFFMAEDDWCCNGKGGFIEKSLVVMESNPKIENVWLADMNKHGFDHEIYYASEVPYRLVKENQNGWHGFATACGLKSMKAYKEIGLYQNIPTGNNIWEWERNIGEEYHKLGYRSAILLDEYVINIGIGQSEYTGTKIF
jgi:GT2 family glycosyltransferase